MSELNLVAPTSNPGAYSNGQFNLTAAAAAAAATTTTTTTTTTWWPIYTPFNRHLTSYMICHIDNQSLFRYFKIKPAFGAVPSLLHEFYPDSYISCYITKHIPSR